MTNEEKQLLIKELCARFPYGVICRLSSVKSADISITEKLKIGGLEHFICGTMDVKPYLRPMSSMIEEERKEYENLFEYEEREYNQGCCFFDEYKIDIDDEYRLTTVIDWLNAHHFDYRGLIEKGLALEAPESMYKTD